MPHPAPHRHPSVHFLLRIIATETTAPPQIEYHVVHRRAGHQGNQQSLVFFVFFLPISELKV